MRRMLPEPLKRRLLPRGMIVRKGLTVLLLRGLPQGPPLDLDRLPPTSLRKEEMGAKDQAEVEAATRKIRTTRREGRPRKVFDRGGPKP